MLSLSEQAGRKLYLPPSWEPLTKTKAEFGVGMEATGKGWEANEYPWSAYNTCIFSGFFMYHEAIISGSFSVGDHLCGTNASGRFAISD